MGPPPVLPNKYKWESLGSVKLRVVEVFEWARYCASMALANSIE